MEGRTIKDRVYGTMTIDASVLIELIDSSPIQRLKGISQFGLPDELYHKNGFSRYDHSIGVLILLKILGASEEEQIAGLLHDVSHTAFSHIVDWVIGDGRSEDFQDDQYETFVAKTRVPQILATHGHAMERINDIGAFPLLEQPAPALCADRIDYTLRESPAVIVERCLPALAVHEKRIVFTDPDVARLFARQYASLQREHWAGLEAVSRYRIFSDLLRKALDRRIISFEDLWQDDAFVLKKLTAAQDPEIAYTLDVLRKRSLQDIPFSDETMVKKFRTIDPDILVDGRVIKLTSIDDAYGREVEAARQENAKGVRIKIPVFRGPR